MNTLYWHDYETSGTDPRYDRPLQFAGIRTDEDLNIIGEPLMIYCKPANDFLPHPQASLITGITPQKAEKEGLTEAEFMARIHAELAEPGTCGALSDKSFCRHFAGILPASCRHYAGIRQDRFH